MNDMRKLMESVNGLSDKDALREYREDDTSEIADELEDIKSNIENLMHEAGNLVDSTDERDSARSYWMGHILGALDNNSEYMSGSMVTMQDTIDAIRGSEVDADEDGYDEDGYDENGKWHKASQHDDPNPRGGDR